MGKCISIIKISRLGSYSKMSVWSWKRSGWLDCAFALFLLTALTISLCSVGIRTSFTSCSRDFSFDGGIYPEVGVFNLFLYMSSFLVKKTAYSREYPLNLTLRKEAHLIVYLTNQTGSTSSFSRGDKLITDNRLERSSVSCYGCGKPGVMKPRCPNCKPTANKDSVNFSDISLHSCSLTPDQSAVLKLTVNGTWGTACSDTGANHTIAAETLYLLLQRKGVNFQKTRLSISLADSQNSKVEVHITNVVIKLEGRVIRTPLIALPYAKGNRTLLGMDFSQNVGFVLNLKHLNWFFCDSPHRTYDFVKEVIVLLVQSRPNIEENACLLRNGKAKCLIPEQNNELSTLLKMYETVFEPEGEPTPFMEHRVTPARSGLPLVP
ncbi:CCHC-type domain-containing protein [Nephila pilipes]|uniref:CCHC-type domain-containing protein n=1 Tax=Nephila pilipes TaxID=299642 RepID=A0A8X6I9X2_NEPPI|nr:CCHC-type domain-containing protein [Nephila pilipes]